VRREKPTGAVEEGVRGDGFKKSEESELSDSLVYTKGFEASRREAGVCPQMHLSISM
jgi:hypothetical protein